MADLTLGGSGRRKLAQLEKRLGNLSRVKKAIAVNQAEEVIDLIKKGFRDEQDPYGRRWKKRRRETTKTAGRKVLSGETSRLKAGWKRTRLGPGGFRVSSSVEYAPHHQNPRKGRGGKLKRAQRMMVPSSRRKLGKRWSKALREAATDALEVYFTKGKS